MSTPSIQVRRATVEDLPALRAMWNAAGLPAAELEKRFNEFQVAGSDGQILGALGLQIAGQHAKLHSETMLAGASVEEIRPALWGRIQTVTRNHGLARLWTQEPTPFWAQQQFAPAAAEVLGRLPAPLGAAAGNWLTLQLKEEAAGTSIEQEFAIFKQASQEENEAILRRAKMIKVIAMLIAFVVFALIVVATVLFFLNRGKLVR
jgi:N-acetylglutamate synthase-like GNAT family acetyltransferase/predicted nucleic acid-binding Zn ribbon protein